MAAALPAGEPGARDEMAVQPKAAGAVAGPPLVVPNAAAEEVVAVPAEEAVRLPAVAAESGEAVVLLSGVVEEASGAGGPQPVAARVVVGAEEAARLPAARDAAGERRLVVPGERGLPWACRPDQVLLSGPPPLARSAPVTRRRSTATR
jgi:hypothetical protein